MVEGTKISSGDTGSIGYSPSTLSNRGWFEIVYSITIESMDGALKTHLMNRCNLNSRQVENYLEVLLGYKLLKDEPSDDLKRTIYKTTELGKKYIEAYKQMSGFFSITV